MTRSTANPNQLALFELCEVCHRQWMGHGHRRCFEALDRWIRPDNVEHVAALLGLDHAEEA